MNGFDPASVIVRAAAKMDCPVIASLYSVSSDGVADYIWTTLAKAGEEPLDVGRRRYEREDSLFSYRSCAVAEYRGLVVGMLVAFPMHVTEAPGEAEPDPVLLPYSLLEKDDSYYICGMAMFPPYRGKGLGTRFLHLAGERAAEQKLPWLSLIVFEQNEPARRLYQRHGFREEARHPVTPHPLIRFTGDALLMVKPVKA